MDVAVLPSTRSIGTTDTLLGLMAFVSQKVHKLTSNEYAGLTDGEIFDGVHCLSLYPRFEKSLEHLDFEQIGDSWCSAAIADFLFQAGTWGLIQKYGFHISYVNPDLAMQRIERLRREYGQETINVLEEMADALIKTTKRYQQVA